MARFVPRNLARQSADIVFYYKEDDSLWGPAIPPVEFAYIPTLL